MDFKARFAGKTSKISKDGDINSNKAGFDEVNSNLPAARVSSIHKNDRNSISGQGQTNNLNNMNLTSNSKFSYKGSERSSHQKIQSQPITKLNPSQITRVNQSHEGKSLINYNNNQPTPQPKPPMPQHNPQPSQDSYNLGQNYHQAEHQQRTPISMRTNEYDAMQEDASSFSAHNRQFQSQNYSHHTNMFNQGPNDQQLNMSTQQSAQKNLYANGARNMAEEVRQSSQQLPQPSPQQQQSDKLSFYDKTMQVAMRMQNNAPATSSQSQNNQFQNGNISQAPSSLYAQNPFAGFGQNQHSTGISNTSNINAGGPVNHNEPSGRMQLINDMNQRNNQNQPGVASPMQSNKLSHMQQKPPSQGSAHVQMLRESREKERHDNLTNISKQIVSPDHHQEANSAYQMNLQKKQSFNPASLPPAHAQSPMRRVGSKQHSAQGNNDSRSNLRVPNKPPSNYARQMRHVSQNKIATPSHGLPMVDQKRMSRDRSSDGLITQQTPTLNQLNNPGDQSHNNANQMNQNQQQLQQQLQLMQQQMLLIQQQQQMAGMGLPVNMGQIPATPQYLPGQNNLEQQQQQFKSQYPNMNQGGMPNMGGLQMSNQVMPNTQYDQPQKMGTLTTDDQISVAGSEKRSKTNYKKYGLKEYKNLQHTLQNTKMGGLGANIGSEEWEAAKRKKEVANQYAQNLKAINQHQNKDKSVNQSRTSERSQIQKEMTKREKALEFAKNNIPKPKMKKDLTQVPKDHNELQYKQEFVGVTDNTPNQGSANQYMDMYGGVDSTGGNQMQADSGALMQLAQKHDQYADEIQKIKDMLGE